MHKLIASFPVSLLIFITLAACAPKFDWRDVHDGISPYTVLMPAKPSMLSREIQIGAQSVTMHMTASQIDRVKFAAGAANMGDPTVAQMTLAVIKTTLIDNMAGHITQDKSSVMQINGKTVLVDEFEADRTAPSGAAVHMLGRLIASGSWVFQMLVVGPEDELNREAADTFLTSFKPV